MNPKLSYNKPLVLAAIGACALLFTASRARARDANQLEILTGFSAKETCSCAFVVEQTDEYCKAFGTLPGYPISLTIDRTTHTVTSQVATTARSARFKEGEGCTTDLLDGVQ